MVFILGVAVGFIATVAFSLLSVASDADDAIDKEYDNY